MTQFIAEFTTNHMGNLNLLLRMVRQAKESKADLIKMQSKDVESFYSKEKLDGEFLSPYGKTYRDYRSLFEFDLEDMIRFDRECLDSGIKWYSTIQDIKSLKEFMSWETNWISLQPMVKVSSSGARNKELLREFSEIVPETYEVVISVAGLLLSEIEEIVSAFPDHRMIIQHCVAEYPTPENNLRLGNITILQSEFESDRIGIGYSSHYPGISDVLAVRDLGLRTVEKHFCVSRNSFVHHIDCSLEPDEFRRMVELYNRETPEMSKGAYLDSFGMSDIEQEFLENQTYGNTFLGKRSELSE